MDDIDLRGVIATNTDTIDRYAMQIQWKIMNIIQDEELPIGLSSARGWNPFPWLYRADAIRQYNIDAFQGLDDNPDWPPFPSGDTLFYDLLSEAVEEDTPVTLLITCPITALSDLLREHSELESGIEKVIWMGGAINVDGNLDSNTIPEEVANPNAEWNAFWDPYAVDWIFENTSIPIIIFPLDVTDQVPLTDDFMHELSQQAPDYTYSDLVYQSYALTSDEPFYRMWNTAATSYVAQSELFDKPQAMNLEVETEGYDQGAIRQSAGGRRVEVVLNFADKDAFYDYVLEQFKRSYAHIETEE
jgi:purine nucleosidase